MQPCGPLARIACLALLALLPRAAAAQTAASAGAQGGSDPCATQANTLEINACLADTLAARDRALNASYQALVKRLAPVDRHDTTDYPRALKHLTEAQRAWIRFRDEDCRGRVVPYEGGSIRGAVHAGCLIRHTEQRTQALQDWMLAR